jgi:UDP-glucose 4-epimerase
MEGVSGARVLVTGGFGFVGSALCRALVELGCEVAALDDMSVGTSENLAAEVARDVEPLVADVRDSETVVRLVGRFRPGVVFHLAAVHFIPTCERHPTLAVGVNVAGTQSVLEACSRAGSVEVVVAASSGAVYEPASRAHHESDALGPTDVYGLTKEWTERLARYFRDSTGISVGIARLFNVIGPGETNPHLLPAIIEQIRNGGRLRLGDLSTRRDYIFTGDVVDGLVRLADGCRTTGLLTCNFGSESATSGSELVDLVARAVGRQVSVTSDPKRLRKSDRPLLLSDCQEARDQLGWCAGTGIVDAVAAALAQPFAHGFRSV